MECLFRRQGPVFLDTRRGWGWDHSYGYKLEILGSVARWSSGGRWSWWKCDAFPDAITGYKAAATMTSWDSEDVSWRGCVLKLTMRISLERTQAMKILSSLEASLKYPTASIILMKMTLVRQISSSWKIVCVHVYASLVNLEITVTTWAAVIKSWLVRWETVT